jgi:hypothetical protein
VRCEVYAGKTSVRARRIMEAMRRSGRYHGIKVVETEKYTGLCPWYMTWGLGHSGRKQWTDRHRANGGHVIAWDLGYWDRENKFRLSINAEHPTSIVSDMPHTRMDDIKFRDEYRDDGHIVVVGLGRKTKAIRPDLKDWERVTIARLRNMYQERQVILRKKGLLSPIEPVIRGASLVVCKHSNVALDACIAGIPVVCDGGIASTLYNNDMRNPVHPTIEQRRQLIANAGWWQWSPSEAGLAWEFIKGVLL